jgi:hypothetical protein
MTEKPDGPPPPLPTLYEQLVSFSNQPFVPKPEGGRMDQIIEIVEKNPGITMTGISRVLDISEDCIRQYNKRLIKLGYKIIRAHPRGLEYYAPGVYSGSEEQL